MNFVSIDSHGGVDSHHGYLNGDMEIKDEHL
jgi:hypothetical protein